MEENALIQPREQGGTYLRAGWKMIPFFALCLLQDTSAFKGPRLVGVPGGTVTIECHYTPTPVNKHQRKYWCRLYPPQRVCHTVISTNLFISRQYQGRVTLSDFPRQGLFVVTLTQVVPEDAGHYRCGIGPRTDKLFISMNLTVSTDSAMLTIPPSIIPMTALATRGQMMETLGTSTSFIGRQELNTTLLAEGWETRTSRKDTTPAEVTQAPRTTGATTTVTGGWDLDTTLLAEGWETRTSRRDTTATDITRAPERTRETAPVIGGQVPKTIKTTASAPGSQVFDVTLVIKGQGVGICRGDITATRVTKASGTIATITSAVGTQSPGTLEETTPAAGRQDLDTSLVAKGQGAEISRDLTLTRVTQQPAQASSKSIQAPGVVRLTMSSTADWLLETTRAADPVLGQISGAKVTSNLREGDLVLGTRAVTKTIVGTVKERRSTIRTTNRLTKETVNTRMPQITTRNIPGTVRSLTMAKDVLREVTPGTDQYTQGIIRATTPDEDVGAWFSRTIRKRKTSALGGTTTIGRESHSEEPLRRIPGATLLIPPSNKPFLDNSSLDQRRVSQILIILSTVLLPFVLLVLLLLLRKLRKRISLQTQKMPRLSLIQLTNFQDFPEKLSRETLQPREA
ncbi:high affinity immunoglobulin alpha and immunoglobulin mu Fc receptor [Dromiciops gliroides]|uniref:high affinity immunoglobulin alpha and immunoglobulin mu Fc receptor n=1 Tax=Dromiciops gliroides TaxID=33562 RepID=UPI001CC73390|nr:high affinity immunoglobulin alpha and immunoglobulin mu Fc receptor [Dromiciops gliroides]